MGKYEKFKFKSAGDLREKALSLGLDLPWSSDLKILLEPIELAGKRIPNRLVVQPMEGYDGEQDGSPGELTQRRYLRYAKGGYGMIWFEATSVVQQGRSNPRQMLLNSKTLPGFAELVEKTKKKSIKKLGPDHEPFLVLQLTHSGRYSKPDGVPSGKALFRSPFLDPPGKELGIYSDEELEEIGAHFQNAIPLAEKAGFDAVDIKVCHGYLLHELLAAYTRENSRFGGSFENRIRLFESILRTKTALVKAVRLNATDMIPHPYGFGMSGDGSLTPDLAEPLEIVEKYRYEVPLWNITAGIPYYNAHIGRPFDRPVHGGKDPDEHPLDGIARMIGITSQFQQQYPDLSFVGTGYSWLRHYFPEVAAGVLLEGKAKLIGLGRSSFAYPDAPLDLMKQGQVDPKKCCISCSRCTEFMRFGKSTGCPIRDEKMYKKRYKEIKFKK